MWVFPGGSLDQRLVVLTQAEADAYGAKCLDGSPPAIYYSPARGTGNQDNWVLYFKGGKHSTPGRILTLYGRVRGLMWGLGVSHCKIHLG